MNTYSVIYDQDQSIGRMMVKEEYPIKKLPGLILTRQSIPKQINRFSKKWVHRVLTPYITNELNKNSNRGFQSISTEKKRNSQTLYCRWIRAIDNNSFRLSNTD